MLATAAAGHGAPLRRVALPPSLAGEARIAHGASGAVGKGGGAGADALAGGGVERDGIAPHRLPKLRPLVAGGTRGAGAG